MNLTIRHSEPGDAESIMRVMTAPRAAWGTLPLPYASADSYRKRYAERPDGMYQLVAVVDGDLVGAASLNTFAPARRRHAGAIGMAVRDDFQGCGIGTALLRELLTLADRWLNLKRVELEVFTDNAPAIALYEKFGFEQEGVLRAYAFRDGAYADTYVMARIRP